MEALINEVHNTQCLHKEIIKFSYQQFINMSESFRKKRKNETDMEEKQKAGNNHKQGRNQTFGNKESRKPRVGSV